MRGTYTHGECAAEVIEDHPWARVTRVIHDERLEWEKWKTKRLDGYRTAGRKRSRLLRINAVGMIDGDAIQTFPRLPRACRLSGFAKVD